MNALTRKSVGDVTRRMGRSLLAVLGMGVGVLGVTAVNEASNQLGGAFFYSTDPSGVPNIVIAVDRLPPTIAQRFQHLPHVQRMQFRTAYTSSWQLAGSTAAHTMQVFAYPDMQHVSLWPFLLIAGHLPGRGEIVLDARNRTTGYPGGIGDTISLKASNGRMIRVGVVGVSRTQGFALGGMFDNPIGYMSQDGLRQITSRQPVETSPTIQILLKTPDASVIQTYRMAGRILQKAHLNIDPKTSDWSYSSGNGDTRLSVTGPLAVIRLLSLLALLLVCAMIFNSVTTLLSEQIKIIGTMKALGGTRWTIVWGYLITGACGEDDPGRCPAERIETKLVVGTRNDVLPEQRIIAGAVVLRRQSKQGRIWRRPVGEVVGKQTLVADEHEKFCHRRPEAAPQVRLVDVGIRRQCRLAIRYDLGGRRLVGHERVDLLGMARNQRECVHRATTAGEEVHRSGVQCADQPVSRTLDEFVDRFPSVRREQAIAALEILRDALLAA